MNDSENDLKKALAENGSFDPDKARELKKQAVAAFNARMRKVERLCWMYIFLCACVGLFAYYRFQSPSTTSTRSLIAYAVLLLIAYESSVLIKLWYWIVNGKLSVLKEIKQLRLESPVAADRDALVGDWGVDRRAGALPRWERNAWVVGILVLVLFVVEYLTPAVYRAIVGHERVPSLAHEGYVTLGADGSGSSVTRTTEVNRGVTPITSLSLKVPAGSAIRWLDDRGRELPSTVATEAGHSRYTVRLVDPVMPGERFVYKRVTESAALATREGDLWTCRADWSFGPQSYAYTETVVLPGGADVVSVIPEPETRFTWDGKPVLRFDARLKASEHFGYEIQYRLPQEEPAIGEESARGRTAEEEGTNGENKGRTRGA